MFTYNANKFILHIVSVYCMSVFIVHLACLHTYIISYGCGSLHSKKGFMHGPF